MRVFVFIYRVYREKSRYREQAIYVRQSALFQQRGAGKAPC